MKRIHIPHQKGLKVNDSYVHEGETGIVTKYMTGPRNFEVSFPETPEDFASLGGTCPHCGIKRVPRNVRGTPFCCSVNTDAWWRTNGAAFFGPPVMDTPPTDEDVSDDEMKEVDKVLDKGTNVQEEPESYVCGHCEAPWVDGIRPECCEEAQKQWDEEQTSSSTGTGTPVGECYFCHEQENADETGRPTCCANGKRKWTLMNPKEGA